MMDNGNGMLDGRLGDDRLETRAEWPPTAQQSKEAMFMRLYRHRSPGTFIPEGYSSIRCSLASSFGEHEAQNNSLWEHAA